MVGKKITKIQTQTKKVTKIQTKTTHHLIVSKDDTVEDLIKVENREVNVRIGDSGVFCFPDHVMFVGGSVHWNTETPAT